MTRRQKLVRIIADQTKSCCCSQHVLVLSIFSFTFVISLIKYISFHSDLTLSVQPYFRAVSSIAILHQDKKTRVEVKQAAQWQWELYRNKLIKWVKCVKSSHLPSRILRFRQKVRFNSDQLRTNQQCLKLSTTISPCLTSMAVRMLSMCSVVVVARSRHCCLHIFQLQPLP